MNKSEIKEAILELDGQNVAVCFNATREGTKGLQSWGVCHAVKFPFYAWLYSFKGNVFPLIPQNIEFIVKLKCEPNEIQY